MINKPVLTLDDAKKIAAAAETEALRNSWRVVIAIVDDGGHLLYLQRNHGTQFGSVEIAIQKARAAVAFQRPTKVTEDAVMGGRLIHLALPGALPAEGGVPTCMITRSSADSASAAYVHLRTGRSRKLV